MTEEKIEKSKLEARALRFKKLYANNSSEAMKKTLSQVRGLKEGDNLFKFMYDRGDGLTFNSEGIPLIYR